jgi:colanic acid biosynthesis glycosyl transferase WcaI
MKILIWTPNYAPEAMGIPPLVTDAAETLAARGHEVHAVTPVPNYPERRIRAPYRGRVWLTEETNGVHVHRHWLRVRSPETFLDKAAYEATSATSALRFTIPLAAQADVILCVVPTLLASVYASLMPFRARVVLWAQDIVVAAAGSIDTASSGLAKRMLAGAARAERSAARRAERIVVCSPGFIDHYLTLGVEASRIDVVYNWADVSALTPVWPPENGGPVRFLYAGNLGYTQGFGTLIDAAAAAGSTLSLDIVGAGNAQDEVNARAAGTQNVVVRPPVSRESMPSLYAEAHVHVVIQRRVSAGANLPSKIATCMASGKPIVASIALDTPAAELLRESGGAIVVPPENVGELAAAMRELANDDGLRRELGRRGREFAERVLSKEVGVRRIEEILTQ